MKELGAKNQVTKTTIAGRKMMIIHKNQGFDDDQRVMKNPTSVFSGAPKVNDHTTSGYSSMKLNEAYSTTDYHGNDQEIRSNALKDSSMVSHDVSHTKVEKAFLNQRNSKPTSSNSIKETIIQDYETRVKKDDESKRLLEATKEIMKLMNRDYGGRKKPKRRTPINNNNPKH
ncbi:uncharacterized protein LOC130803929 [Amaranthus tricolor]|uniref:uncharacterized protein LOC130803929 n=1 Tax=Amaranthus tricolor TaxID=29722 RepID=UPI00258EAA27|nr:uncharacterized protein LOC130803929 [Amaranthus tricolor]